MSRRVLRGPELEKEDIVGLEFGQDWQRYLARLLSDEGTAPGLDVVATAIGSREKEEETSIIMLGISREDDQSNVFRSEDISVQACPMNHLVFDFSKHELVVRAQAQASQAKGPHDPEALWLELLQQYRASAVVVADCVLTFAARSEQSGRCANLTLVKELDTAETLAIFVDDKPARVLARGALEVQPARKCLQWTEMEGTRSSWSLGKSMFEALNSFMASSGFIFERYEVSLAALAREGTSFHHAGEQNGITLTLKPGLFKSSFLGACRGHVHSVQRRQAASAEGKWLTTPPEALPQESGTQQAMFQAPFNANAVLWLAAKYAGQGGGQIRLQEFCASRLLSDQEVWLFVCGIGGSGANQALLHEVANKIGQAYDADKNGVLTFDEFVQLRLDPWRFAVPALMAIQDMSEWDSYLDAWSNNVPQGANAISPQQLMTIMESIKKW
eukprot:s138_g13.t1